MVCYAMSGFLNQLVSMVSDPPSRQMYVCQAANSVSEIIVDSILTQFVYYWILYCQMIGLLNIN